MVTHVLLILCRFDFIKLWVIRIELYIKGKKLTDDFASLTNKIIFIFLVLFHTHICIFLSIYILTHIHIYIYYSTYIIM